jgi:hypothetical protein
VSCASWSLRGMESGGGSLDEWGSGVVQGVRCAGLRRARASGHFQISPSSSGGARVVTKLSNESGSTQQGSDREKRHEDDVERWPEGLHHRALDQMRDVWERMRT